MGKVFDKNLFGTKTVVICGRTKAPVLADRLLRANIASAQRCRDIMDAVEEGKFDSREYGISMDKGTYGKKSVFIKKGYLYQTYNESLIPKDDIGVVLTAPNRVIVPYTDKNDITISKDEYKKLVETAAICNNTKETNKNTGDDIIMTNTNKANGLFGNGMKDMVGKLMGQCGFVGADDVRITFNGGLCFFDKKRDRWLAYDIENKQLIDQFGLAPEFEGAIAIPTTLDKIKEGDLIKTPAGNYAFVYSTNPLRVFTKTSTVSKVKEVGNIFGTQQFWTVVKPIFGGGVEGVDPMMLMMMNKNKGNTDIKDMLMMSMMRGNKVLGSDGGFNPMMMFMMDKNGGQGGIKDMLMMSMMTGNKMFGQDGGFNPMMLIAMGGDENIDMKDMAMMSMMGGNKSGSPFGNMFGGQVLKPEVTKDVEANTIDPRDAEIAFLKGQLAAKEPIVKAVKAPTIDDSDSVDND